MPQSPRQTSRPQGKRQRARYTELTDLWLSLAQDTRHPELFEGRLPKDWRGIDDRPVPDKTRVILRMDADVAKFFRSFGSGYQGIVNKVLRAYMLSRLCELVPLVEEPPSPLTEADRRRADMERDLAHSLEDMRRRRMRRAQEPKPAQESPRKKPLTVRGRPVAWVDGLLRFQDGEKEVVTRLE